MPRRPKHAETNEIKRGHPRVVFPGDRFGRLVVLNETGNDRHDKRRYQCRCDCGSMRTYLGNNLRKGESKSCGCARRETRQKNALNLEPRFWAKVRKGGGCWRWLGDTDKDGYGFFRAWDPQPTRKERRKHVKAHRFAWELKHGPIPSGLCVCHDCDNPRCVRASHLFLGTHTDNIADRDQKGRTAKGEAHHFAKLTTKDVRRIRKLAASSQRSRRELAKEYNMSQSAIGRVVGRVTWKHVRS